MVPECSSSCGWLKCKEMPLSWIWFAKHLANWLQYRSYWSKIFLLYQNSSHLELEASVEASKAEDEESLDLPLFCHLNSEIEQDLYMLIDTRETEYLRERRRHYSQKNLSQVFNHVLLSFYESQGQHPTLLLNPLLRFTLPVFPCVWRGKIWCWGRASRGWRRYIESQREYVYNPNSSESRRKSKESDY